MESRKFTIELLQEAPESECVESYIKVCSYLLKRYYEGCEEFESFGISEGINGGASRERLFHTCSENGGSE